MILLFFLYLLRTRELLVTGASNNERLQRNYFFSREAKNLMDNKSIYIAAPTYSVSIKKLKYVYKMAQGNAVVWCSHSTWQEAAIGGVLFYQPFSKFTWKWNGFISVQCQKQQDHIFFSPTPHLPHSDSDVGYNMNTVVHSRHKEHTLGTNWKPGIISSPYLVWCEWLVQVTSKCVLVWALKNLATRGAGLLNITVSTRLTRWPVSMSFIGSRPSSRSKVNVMKLQALSNDSKTTSQLKNAVNEKPSCGLSKKLAIQWNNWIFCASAN